MPQLQYGYGQSDLDEGFRPSTLNYMRYGSPIPPSAEYLKQEEEDRRVRDQASLFAFEQRYKRDTTPPTLDEDLRNENSSAYETVPDASRQPEQGEVSVEGQPAGLSISHMFAPTKRQLKPEYKPIFDSMRTKNSDASEKIDMRQTNRDNAILGAITHELDAAMGNPAYATSQEGKTRIKKLQSAKDVITAMAPADTSDAQPAPPATKPQAGAPASAADKIDLTVSPAPTTTETVLKTDATGKLVQSADGKKYFVRAKNGDRVPVN